MTWQPIPALALDVEAWAISFLKAALAARTETYASSVTVTNVVPATMPTRLVQVRRDGGQVRGMFDRPRLAVRCWAATEKDVTDLARLVNALMLGAPLTQPVVSVVHQSGPLPIADGTKPQRYSLFEITTRVTELT